MKIVYQGVPGAYSHMAAVTKVPDARPSGQADFAAVANAVISGRAELGLLPVWNSIVGEVSEAAAVLRERQALEVVDRFDQRIAHCLLALPGADLASIRWAESHPVALAQCTRWLSARRLAPRVVGDTAGAARAIAADRDWTRAAIAPAEAAELYGLAVLARDIADAPDNRTTFVVVRRKAMPVVVAA
ncbi:MAG TPA: prephenate dehydratase domain-containing protein [Gemmatimonadales bacterium]|nr:prephenate dehydratase domain-containing protein [Gemmatimonadales bacterium]